MNCFEEFSISHLEKAIIKHKERQDRLKKMSLMDRCFKKSGSSLFDKAMKEVREQEDQAKQKVETKNKCSHPDSINHCGWKTCVSCGLCLRRLIATNVSGYEDRAHFSNTGPSKGIVIMNTLRDMICSLVGKYTTLLVTECGIPFNGIPLMDHQTLSLGFCLII